MCHKGSLPYKVDIINVGSIVLIEYIKPCDCMHFTRVTLSYSMFFLPNIIALHL